MQVQNTVALDAMIADEVRNTVVEVLVHWMPDEETTDIAMMTDADIHVRGHAVDAMIASRGEMLEAIFQHRHRHQVIRLRVSTLAVHLAVALRRN